MRVKDIAVLLTEDPSVMSAYADAWKRESSLELSDYYNVVGLLKQIAEENGCELDIPRLTVKLIPPGFVIKNISLHCPDIKHQRELAKRLSDQLDDQEKRHKFEHNLKANLYQAINKQFGDAVRRELGLEISHQVMDVGPNSKVKRKDVLPMATVIKLDKVEEPPEEEEPLFPPGGELGAEEPPLPGEEEMLPSEEGMEEPPPGGEPGPAQPVDELLPPEEEEPVEFESISRIASLISEDINWFGE